MAKRVDTVSSGVDRSAADGRKGAVTATEAKDGANFVSGSDAAADAPVGGAGETLEGILQKAGRLSPLDALRYLTPLMSVLGTLHANHQAHGNLSLDVMRVTKGNDGALRLQLLKGRKSQPTMRDTIPNAAVSGHMLLYSSQEQIQGAAASEFDDMYAVGLLAYTLLVGEPYWADEADRLGFMAFCKTILGGLPEAPSVRALRRKAVRLPQDFDAWFVLITDRKHPDRFPDITDASIALTSVLSNPDLRELSRSVQVKFNPNILDMPAVPPAPPLEAPSESDNLRLTVLFTIVASLSVALVLVLLLRWSTTQEPSSPTPLPTPMALTSTSPTTAPSAAINIPARYPR
jgi:eukaryotic-like serine/threonine-protein kinase